MNNTNIVSIADNIKLGKNVDVASYAELQRIDKNLAKDQQFQGKTDAFAIIFGTDARRAVILYPKISSSRISLVMTSRIDSRQLVLVLDHVEIIGNIELPSLRGRITDDWRSLVVALTIFVVIAVVLGTSANSVAFDYAMYLHDPSSAPILVNFINLYSTIGQALLTILTLFLTVFVLYTISQNSALSTDTNLYRTGQAHKYVRDDNYIAITCAISLFLSLFALVINAFPSDFALFGFSLNKINFIIPLLYAGAAAGMFICFASLAYYARRVLVANESNLVSAIIQEKLQKKS